VDLVIGRGESVGIIGPNGAGKSTLLRCIAGICGIDDGSIEVRGRPIPMLELGVGFNGELDGWENLQTALALMGPSTGHPDDALVEEIVDFSGVRRAMERPVKHWSSGMRARLGFAVASHVGGSVVLVDELLAVGDREFRMRALERLAALRDDGCAVVLVSHDLELVADVCERAVRLHDGVVVEDGSAVDVIEHYGGVGWSGAPTLGTAHVTIHGLRPVRRGVNAGESVPLTAQVVVTKSSPQVGIELSLRDPAGREAPDAADEIDLYTIAEAEIVPAGALVDVGVYELAVDSGPLKGIGNLDLVLTAVDHRSGAKVAESWAGISLGGGRSADAELPVAFTFAAEIDVVGAPSG
jgi:ABC-type polysaccharide/polyol phosphate transport system ATPase subunit